MQSTKLIYFYDALCGWCYGFAPVIAQLHAEMGDTLSFDVVSGGMVTGARIGPIGAVAGYISWAYKDVERATGVTFGEGFLQGTMAQGTAIFTSVPPALALAAFRQQQPTRVLDFAGALQRAVYADGIAPLDYDAYAPYARELGADGEALVAAMHAPATLAAAEAEFAQTAAYGVQGFPTVVVQHGEQAAVVARGYTALAPLRTRVRAALSQLAE